MGSERNSTALREITRWVKGNNGCFDLARFQRDVLKAGGRVVLARPAAGLVCRPDER